MRPAVLVVGLQLIPALMVAQESGGVVVPAADGNTAPPRWMASIAGPIPTSGLVRQAPVAPEPSWPRGVVIGGVAGGAVGLVIGFAACSETLVVDRAVDPTGRTTRPADCVIAYGVVGLVAGALIGYVIERSTQNKRGFRVLIRPQGKGGAQVGGSVAF